MKYLSYGWSVFINLITLGIVILIFNSLNSNFEFLVISILVLLYGSVHSVLSFQNVGYAKIFMNLGVALNNEFKRLRKLFGDKVDFDEENEINTLRESEAVKAQEVVEQATVKVYIDGAFLGVIELIALWNLFMHGLQ